MIANRQRGFVNLYVVFVSVIAAALILLFAMANRWLDWIQLVEGLNISAYVLVVFVGMLAAGGVLRREAPRLHSLQWGQALNMALKQTAIVAACVFALMFAAKDRAISRLFLGEYLIMLCAILVMLHSCLPRILAKVLFASNTQLRTVLVGFETGPNTLMPWVKDREHLGMQIVGYVADDQGPGIAGKMPWLGTTQQLKLVLRQSKINQVILLNGMDNPARMEELVAVCESEGCRFLIHNGFGSKFGRNLTGIEEGGQSFFILQNEPLEDPVNRMMKRGLDIAVSLPVVLLIIPPLALVIWVVQRFQSPGPLFFICTRQGRQQKPFSMFKFRSMYVSEFDVSVQAKPHDERVYPFGRFLRRRSLDEFPQFINVLKGEMTLVGPRPHLPGHDVEFSQLDRSYPVRSLIKPGITGLAQIQGFRGEITNLENLRGRVRGDLYYLGHWSIWMDLRIIALTAVHVFSPPKTAY